MRDGFVEVPHTSQKESLVKWIILSIGLVVILVILGLIVVRLVRALIRSKAKTEALQAKEKYIYEDAMTKLFNRHYLYFKVEPYINKWTFPQTIAICDLNNLKIVNDKYGHAAGDKVLKTVAQLFISQTRTTDLIARYGGEEFMGVFSETKPEEIEILANKIRKNIMESKFHYEGDSVQVTVSAGLAHFRQEDTIKDVFKRADEALYLAKAQGRNCCVSGG